MVVFTGLSGSGKSSLAFDTIFAEGQRRYIESLSAYARQFLGGMQKPDVDEITGLSPAISIDQKAHSANPRSTVATITEIYDYLRVLYARVGVPHCPMCGTLIEKMTVDEMSARVIKNLKKQGKDKDVIILSPVVRGRKGEYYQMLYDLYNSGYLEVRVDGKMKSLRERIVLEKNNKHTIEVVVDKITCDHCHFDAPNGGEKSLSGRSKQRDRDSSCIVGMTACALDRDPSRSFGMTSELKQRLSEAVETAVDLSNGLCAVIYPDGSEQVLSTEYSCPNDGYSFPEIEPRLFSFNSPYGYCEACTGLGTKELFSEEICPKCDGKRLNENALAVKIDQKNIWEVTNLSIAEAREFFAQAELDMNPRELEICGMVMKEIQNRLQFMFDVGLHYLTLNRRAGTLSGGEAQRIRLASQVGTKLVGALYVLDEPTIGLHQRDNDQLVKTLRALCEAGNTIIVVEHDEDTIRESDWIVDIGPGAGKHGGEIVYSGTVPDLLASKKHQSLTGQYLRGEKKIEIPSKRRDVGSATPKLKIKKAKEHNLKNISVEIPLRRFVCLTGVSGSGKSTLMNDVLRQAVINKLFRINKKVACAEVSGTEYLDGVITIDQGAIGRTSRSNPATYTKAFDHIRDLFAATVEARMRGFSHSRFSFNVPGGRCENCEGKGMLEIEMHFLPSVQVACDVCKGKRFTQETLNIHYKEKNIADVLEMTIADAEDFFKDIPMIYDKLKILNEVGLDYLTLGQSAPTLSGGEAQRIKLSRELARYGTTKTLYLLDEPTTGLHYDDVKKLLVVVQRLVDRGNTVLVIEHNLDVLKCADWIIDLGPEGGDKGGELVAVGTPEDVARKSTTSFTGQYLKRVLKQ
ncbi:MAG: excinuclease ABC subunit A [Candidatus Magasanikbacteria bacterium RIFOXYA2_FULL_44_8]|uniref:UvrABC system protein A n=1 Tax=Candidatus Magasanikbacteria bacterium RIFOXYA2_FULL_44_8 TaxID=1798696 RepID=A0A1F6NL44_9BACT|nr:MAG: excinuclease ABC subunit A [Candidatus Magasanikbacteria bacterium RIFOXYA2_FULL_44_8]